MFNSRRARGPVAQRLEQGTHNPLVPGSNPGGPTLNFQLPIFDCRSCAANCSDCLGFVEILISSARETLRNRPVDWVLAYDLDRVSQNAANLLVIAIPDDAVGRVLDRTSGRAPPYFVLSGQNQAANLFRFADKL